MHQRREPVEYRSLIWAGFGTLVAVLAVALDLVDDLGCGMPIRQNVECSFFPTWLYEAMMSAAALLVVFGAYRTYRDLVAGDFYDDLRAYNEGRNR